MTLFPIVRILKVTMLNRASSKSQAFHACLGLNFCALFLIALLTPQFLQAQDIARLQAGVVKITAKPPSGTANIGTGFIVRLDKDAVYLVTAAHVVAGDQHPRVEFFTKRNVTVSAEVLGLEGDDEVRGLALLAVRGAENLPSGLAALSLAGAARLTGGEDILVIGFPRNAGPWAIVKGNISSRQGRDIYFSPSVESGHSGGPIFQGGKVVAVVGSGNQSVGRGVTVRSVQDYIEGFGISLQESPGILAASTAPTPVPTPPTVVAKPESPPITQPREITGKDGAPMVMVPAGEFWMGSVDGEGGDDERPRHRVMVDGFYMDKFEVTVARYAEFVRATNRPGPSYWDELKVDIQKSGNYPVVVVSWHDAEVYCGWAGKRLPTEAEWEKAARGTDGSIYPWGNEVPREWLSNFAKTESFHESFFGGRRRVLPLEPVDSYEAGKSYYGVYHMAGNVSEWTADRYEGDYYSKSPHQNPKGPLNGIYRVLRGGSWRDGPKDIRAANRIRYTSISNSYEFGFRCAQDVRK